MNASPSQSVEVVRSPRTFTPFLRLPQEIQDQIWLACLGPPRLIYLEAKGITGAYVANMSDLTCSSAHERPFSNVWGPQFLGYYIQSFCCPPVLLYVSQRSRQIMLENYETSFQNLSSPDMRMFYEAVFAFGVEWPGDSDGVGTEFLEKEKALLQEAEAFLPTAVVESYRDIQYTKFPTEWQSVARKEVYFQMKQFIFNQTKDFFEKVRTRPFGIWFRPTWDTIVLRNGQGAESTILSLFKEGDSEAGNVRSFAIDEYLIGEDKPRVWDTLFGRGRPRRTTAGFDSDSDSDSTSDDVITGDGAISVIKKPLLTNLEELIVIVSVGFYDYRPAPNEAYVDYTYEELKELKQECHDRVLLRMKYHSALTKIPAIKIQRERDMYGWTSLRYEEPLRPAGGAFSTFHNNDCHRASRDGKRPIDGTLL